MAKLSEALVANALLSLCHSIEQSLLVILLPIRVTSMTIRVTDGRSMRGRILLPRWFSVCFSSRSVYREFSYFRFFFRAIRADCEKNPPRFPSSGLASLLDGAHCIGIGTRSPLTLRTGEPFSYIACPRPLFSLSLSLCVSLFLCSANKPFLPLNRELSRDSAQSWLGRDSA